jgi:hypothetical protein
MFMAGLAPCHERSGLGCDPPRPLEWSICGGLRGGAPTRFLRGSGDLRLGCRDSGASRKVTANPPSPVLAGHGVGKEATGRTLEVLPRPFPQGPSRPLYGFSTLRYGSFAMWFRIDLLVRADVDEEALHEVQVMANTYAIVDIVEAARDPGSGDFRFTARIDAPQCRRGAEVPAHRHRADLRSCGAGRGRLLATCDDRARRAGRPLVRASRAAGTLDVGAGSAHGERRVHPLLVVPRDVADDHVVGRIQGHGE